MRAEDSIDKAQHMKQYNNYVARKQFRKHKLPTQNYKVAIQHITHRSLDI